MRQGRKLRLRIWLITWLCLMFLGWATTARSDESHIDYFQLAVGESSQRCLRQFIGGAAEKVVGVGTCADLEASLWQRGKKKTLVLIAGGDPTELCLTRGEETSLYVTLCYEGINNEQSWTFNEQSQVFLFTNGKRGDPLIIGGALQNGESSIQQVQAVRSRF